MPKKNKTTEEHLEIIEYLLAGILLKKEPSIIEVAKVIGCSNHKLINLYPEKKKKSNRGT